MNRSDKESRLKNNIDMAVERELRQIEQQRGRSRKSGEKDKLKRKWIRSAERIDKSKLSEVWNQEKSEDKGIKKGYFVGLNFDKQGNIV